jgi:hypothetical protein
MWIVDKNNRPKGNYTVSCEKYFIKNLLTPNIFGLFDTFEVLKHYIFFKPEFEMLFDHVVEIYIGFFFVV